MGKRASRTWWVVSCAVCGFHKNGYCYSPLAWLDLAKAAAAQGKKPRPCCPVGKTVRR